MSLWPPAWHGLAIPWVLCEVMMVRCLNLGDRVEVHQVFLWSCIAHYIVSGNLTRTPCLRSAHKPALQAGLKAGRPLHSSCRLGCLGHIL